MSKRIYIDTNVWLDYFFDRNDRLRPLGAFAYELLVKTVSCQYVVVVSDWLRIELEAQGCLDDYSQALEWLHEKVVSVKTDAALRRKAKRRAHWQDEMHALLAQKAGAEVIVTRNVHDFEDTAIIVRYPEQL